MTAGTGHCPHCGRPDAPLDSAGYIDRHRRADWDQHSSPGNELCYINTFAHLRPGDTCHHLAANQHCRATADTTRP